MSELAAPRAEVVPHTRVAPPFSIVCISPQVWAADLPTNRQQIMRRAARHGHAVVFVESGSFLFRDAGHVLRHPLTEFRRRLRGDVVEAGVSVRSALNVLPWGKRFDFARRVNVALTARALRRTVETLPSPIVLWLYDPTGEAIIGSLDEAVAVYDCVDDYAQQYAPDTRRMRLVAAADERAGERASLVFATTEALTERHQRVNSKTYLVRNAADYDHFSVAADRDKAHSEVRDLPRPVVGFAGNMLSTKVDFALLWAVAARRPEWTLLLIGPARDDSRAALARLAGLPNVTWLGWKPYDELPQYVAAFDVGLCPYLSNPYTENVFPLKVYEYLAAGIPVVASGTPSLRGMEPDVVLADGPEAAIRSVEDALALSTCVDRERRMALARGNTLEARTNRLLGLIDAELRVRASTTP